MTAFAGNRLKRCEPPAPGEAHRSFRRGFIATPRRVVPVLVVLVAALAFISFAEGSISPGRLVATLLVGVAIAAMFALLYALSRPRRTALIQE